MGRDFRGHFERDHTYEMDPLANANQIRDWHIYADFSQILIAQARSLYAEEDFGLELDQSVLRHFGKCSENSSVDRHLGLCSGNHH